MTSNSITEQARDEIAGWTIGSGYYQTTIGVDEAKEIVHALADAGLLAHPAPATEDEAAEYVPAYHVYGDVVPIGVSSRDRSEVAAEVDRMREASPVVFLAERVRTEWREVSR